MVDTLQIFISYRRDDGRNHAAFLYWQLLERLPSTLFLDIESITPGADFKNSLDVALDSCDVLLALIGKAWNGEAGSPPLPERPDDFVRMEISSALARGTPVIPLLLDGAEMPPADRLPPDLAALSFRQALSLTEETKLQDAARLARELVTLLNRERTHKAGSSSSTLAEDVAHQQRLTRDREEETQIKRLRQSGLRPELVIQEGHSSAVHAVAFHPNGSWVASGSSDYTIRIWEAATGKVIFVLAGHTGSVNAVAFSPDGKLLASGGYDRTVRVWDLSTGDVLRLFEGHTYHTDSVVFSPSGESVLVAGGDIRSWDVETGQLIRRFEEGWFARYSPDGSMVVAPFHDGVLRMWNAQTGNLLRTLQIAERNSGLPLFAHFSPDGRYILTGCAGSSTVSFWDVASGDPEKTIETDFTGHGVRSAALSHDGKCLAVTDTEQRFQLWNVETCRLDYESQSNDYEAIDSICFDPGGGLIACANRRKAVVLMDRRGSLLRTFDGWPAASTAVGIARDQKTIVVFSGSQTSTIWNAQEERKVCEVESSSLRLVRFSFDGMYAVLKNNSNMNATLFETTGRKIADLQAGEGAGNLAFSADNEMLAALHDAVDVLRIRTGHRVRKFRTTDVGIRCIAFNPVNGHLAGGCEGGVIRFWEPESGKQTLNLRGPEADVLALDFNPRFPILASGNSAGNLILWDLASNSQILKTLAGPAEPISHLQFDREGAMIACQNRAVGEIRVWDVKDGALIQTISKCENVEYFEFTDSGASLVLTEHSSTDGTTIRVVSVSTGLEIGTLKAYRDGHWIAVEHDGCYASSERMPAKVGWRIGGAVFQCASLHEEFRLTACRLIR